MEQNNIKIGNIGEKIACLFLIKNGYKIISKNTRISHKEIDIIVEKNNQLRFIEVKTTYSKNNRSTNKPEDYLSFKKIKLLKAAIYEYCLILAKNEENVHLDLIAINIIKTKKIANIKHFLDIT
jgi:putative endonuclease